MNAKIEAATLDLLPSTSTSADTPSGALIQRTLHSFQKSSTDVLWADSSSHPPRILILRRFVDAKSSSTSTEILSPLAPLLDRPPTTTTLPIGSPAALSLNSFHGITDIVTFTFPSAPSSTLQSNFKKAAGLLTTDITEASQPGGRDDHPCTLQTCYFDDDEKAHVWVSWKDKERREKFRGIGGGRANLHIMMGQEFQGCDLKGMGEDFWGPLKWLGSATAEEKYWEFKEVEEERQGWMGWLRGSVGL